jgi:hypothetical protein
MVRLLVSFTTIVLEGYILQMFATFQFKICINPYSLQNRKYIALCETKQFSWLLYMGIGPERLEGITLTKIEWLRQHLNKISEQLACYVTRNVPVT